MSLNSGPLSKRDRLDALLEQGMVQILLDSRIEGVFVPPALDGDLQLRLNLSRRFGLPIELDTAGITATLTFSKVPYECRIPWKAVYAIISYVTGEPFLFPDDVPLEMVLEADVDAESQPEPHPLPATAPKRANIAQDGESRPALRLVSSPEKFEEPPPADTEPPPEAPLDPPPPNKRSHLRVVK